MNYKEAIRAVVEYVVLLHMVAAVLVLVAGFWYAVIMLFKEWV